MIHQLSKSNFVQMPWKNGKGTTTQICISPQNSKFENNDFTYRLSSAPIDQESQFSVFSGKNRILVPIQGAGFRLNNHAYSKFEVAQFSGNEDIHCTLLKGPIVDLGLIYDPLKVKVQTRIFHLKSDLSFSLDPHKEVLITLLDGAMTYKGYNMEKLETLQFQNENHCELKPNSSATVIYFSLEMFFE